MVFATFPDRTGQRVVRFLVSVFVGAVSKISSPGTVPSAPRSPRPIRDAIGLDHRRSREGRP